MTTTATLDPVSALQALQRIHEEESALDARRHFEAEDDRLQRFGLQAAGLALDFSKQSMSARALDALIDYAEACGLEHRRAELASGAPVNATEKRAASHMALRGAGADADALAAAEAERKRARDFAAAVRSGRRLGATGEPIRSIIHIGIGGSDLGPRLVYDALRPSKAQADGPDIDVHFVASVDPTDLDDALEACDPASTLVFIVSKSFTTAETRANGAAARAWLASHLGEEAAGKHLLAATARPDLAKAEGMDEDAVFAMWDWVGGRFSVSSVVSLSVEIALGSEVFDAFLAGAKAMDDHFLQTDLARNAPVMMALTGFWHRSLAGRQSLAVCPYAKRLRLFPAYLQQLVMESLGKSVRHSGEPAGLDTAAVIWGAEGPNAQHSFYQMLHQGTSVVPVDFIALAYGPGDPQRRRIVMANAIAQAEALLRGRSAEEAGAEVLNGGESPERAEYLGAHKAMPGGRPSTFILAPHLSPGVLGALIALYEHKVFVQSVLWGLNAFDQWGVELGKTLAKAVQSDMETGRQGDQDPSTRALIRRFQD